MLCGPGCYITGTGGGKNGAVGLQGLSCAVDKILLYVMWNDIVGILLRGWHFGVVSGRYSDIGSKNVLVGGNYSTMKCLNRMVCWCGLVPELYLDIGRPNVLVVGK